jgi:urease beta subunit
MCGNELINSDENDHKDGKDQQDQDTSNMITEQIDGSHYTFDTANCALMFKRFCAVYGSSFADE